MRKELHLYGFWKCRKSKKPITLHQHSDIHLMSMNVRCISLEDKKKRNWLYRAAYLRRVIEEESPDIIGFQEMTNPQMKYFEAVLPQFTTIHRPRDNKKYGESNAICFNKDKFQCLKSGTFWLSETPEVISKSWGSQCLRICTYVCLRENSTGKEFAVLNTHLDHISEEARIKGIQLIKSKLTEIGFEKTPKIIMGDMNDTYGSRTIDTLLGGYIDASSLTHQEKQPTYNAYGNDAKAEKIDYMAFTKYGFILLDYQTITRLYDDGVYPSDHWPIKTVFDLV